VPDWADVVADAVQARPEGVEADGLALDEECEEETLRMVSARAARLPRRVALGSPRPPYSTFE